MGVIGSLGVRRDAASVPLLAALLGDADLAVARAAAFALGDIRTPEAAQALAKGKSTRAEANLAATDASLACAEQLLADGKRAEALAVYKRFVGDDQPKHVRLAATRGMLACAGKSRVAADHPSSLARRLRREGHPLAAGLRGLPGRACSRWPRSSFADEETDNELVQMVVNLLNDKDKDVRALGLEQVRTAAKSPAATQQFAAQLPKLPRDAQVGLLSALADRGDPVARPAVLDVLATSRDEPVRLAAIGAVGFLGEPADSRC